jgi:exonuclease V gamma subunit
MRLYAQGLQAPLMLFPNTAWALVGLGKERDARDAWIGGDFPRSRRGERDDPAYRIVLRGRPDPVETQTPDFLHCAHTVFGPLRDHANPG